MSPRVECNGYYLGFTATSASQVQAILLTGTTGVHHPYSSFLVFLVETVFHHVDQAGVELLTSGDLLTSASQSAKITSMSNCAQPKCFINN